MGGMLSFPQYTAHTYLFIVAISLTASTPPGSGSKSMKKFFDSQIVMAFCCNSKATASSVYTDEANVYQCNWFLVWD